MTYYSLSRSFFSLGTNPILQNLGECTEKLLLTDIITLLLLFVAHNALLLLK